MSAELADKDLAEHFRFERLRLEPGDIAVFTTDMTMTTDQATELRKRATEVRKATIPTHALQNAACLSAFRLSS